MLLDRVFGEPKRLHPLVGFGTLADRVEALVRESVDDSPQTLRRRGVVAVAVLLVPIAFVATVLSDSGLGMIFDILVLYLAIGQRSLADHARAVQSALEAGDLVQARERVSWLVTRNTAGMTEQSVSRATVESVLENGSDAVYGAMFWFALAGAPGVVVYRLANTLDAMWGYRTERYRAFGWAAARLDDLLNWIPARLTALTYASLGNRQDGMRAWREQGPGWESPNAGAVMAAGAGALGVTLGGSASYHGAMRERPVLGFGPPPESRDIARALRMVANGAWVWAAVILLVSSII